MKNTMPNNSLTDLMAVKPGVRPIKKDERMWRAEKPKADGYYWFYGSLSGDSREKHLDIVEIMSTNIGMLVVAHNEYHDHAVGLWSEKIHEPTIPDSPTSVELEPKVTT